MKLVVVIGGVISGVGKGITTASIGKILQKYGFSVTAIKIDPYINYDAGTLRPTEHGEVWVTDDGGEIDQDLGNYERFLGFEIPKQNCITTGQIFKTVIDKERRGEYLGKTVEFIPHIPDEIKRRVRECAKKPDGSEYDFVLIEVGGTIGEYQQIPFLFAMKGLELELGKENVVYVLVSYFPVPSNIGEMKSKPTQVAIKMLNENAIWPDFVLCRAREPLDLQRKKKIELYANINSEYVISAPTVESIYEVPLNFEKERLGEKLLQKFKAETKEKPDWSSWEALLKNIKSVEKTINVAIVGKYLDIGNYSLTDSYISIQQALIHAAANNNVKAKMIWVDAKQIEANGPESLRQYHGIIIPGGFGNSGVEGKIIAAQFARENNIPYLGLCYGLQMAVVEFARNVCKLEDAHTQEVKPDAKSLVVKMMPAQEEILKKSRYGASMRLGSYAASLKNSQIKKLYETAGRIAQDKGKIEWFKNRHEEFRVGKTTSDSVIFERHRHRYEVNPEFVALLEKNGLVFSGFHERNDGTKLAEFIELPKNDFFIGTQAHPEFRSSLEHPAPLFMGFIEACTKNA